MKTRYIIFALLILFTISCTSKSTQEEHGHEHDTEEAHGHEHDEESDHEHEDEEHLEQEEFTVGEDSTHTHDDGSEHHDH
jgi:ABC-type nickel/cobalt efflux system permease component RcnA